MGVVPGLSAQASSISKTIETRARPYRPALAGLRAFTWWTPEDSSLLSRKQQSKVLLCQDRQYSSVAGREVNVMARIRAYSVIAEYPL
jgi:hypothetical protein